MESSTDQLTPRSRSRALPGARAAAAEAPTERVLPTPAPRAYEHVYDVTFGYDADRSIIVR